MSQSRVSIKAEFSGAVATGIRQRGPDAVGLLLIGIARLIVGAATLAALLGLASAFGYDTAGAPLASITGISAAITWIAAFRPGANSTSGDRAEQKR